MRLSTKGIIVSPRCHVLHAHNNLRVHADKRPSYRRITYAFDRNNFTCNSINASSHSVGRTDCVYGHGIKGNSILRVDKSSATPRVRIIRTRFFHSALRRPTGTRILRTKQTFIADHCPRVYTRNIPTRTFKANH